MKEKINQELSRLQKELSKLESAVAQIEKAEKISTSVIDAVKEVQKNYADHLTSVQKSTDKYLKDSAKQAEEKIKHVLNIQLKQTEETKKTITALQAEIKKAESGSQAGISKLIDKTTKDISALTKSHNEQIEKVNLLLKDYLELASSTAQLSDKIDEVNFPVRLDKIMTNTGEINKEIRNIQADVKRISEDETITNLQKKVTKNNRKINFTIFTAIIILLVMLFVAYDLVIIKHFPNLDFWPK